MLEDVGRDVIREAVRLKETTPLPVRDGWYRELGAVIPDASEDFAAGFELGLQAARLVWAFSLLRGEADQL
jgi:hypothetical protein